MAYAAALTPCEDEAGRLTYLADALGLDAGDWPAPRDLPAPEFTDEELRQWDIAYVIEHRELIERLAADLELE